MNAQANPRSPSIPLRCTQDLLYPSAWGRLGTEDRENNLVLNESIFILDYTGSSFSNMVKKTKTPNKI